MTEPVHYLLCAPQKSLYHEPVVSTSRGVSWSLYYRIFVFVWFGTAVSEYVAQYTRPFSVFRTLLIASQVSQFFTLKIQQLRIKAQTSERD